MNRYIRDYECIAYDTIVVNINNLKNYKLNDNFNILHVNIRSINFNFDELTIFLEYLSLDYGIIVLTETFQIENCNLFQLKGFKCIYNEGSYNKNDGVVVYIKENLSFDYKIVEIGETKAIEMSIGGGRSKNMRVTAIYRSPHQCARLFNQSLYNYLETNSCQKHVIVGDININILNNEDLAEEYKNIMNTFGFISFINKCTRPASRTCLDHIFAKGWNTKSTPGCISGYILDYLITDHNPTMLSCSKAVEPKQLDSTNKEKTYINYEQLKQGLLGETWQGVYSEKDVNKATETFIYILTNYIKENTIHVKIKNKNVKRKSWISPALLKLIIKKK